jgi:hypothetical protein
MRSQVGWICSGCVQLRRAPQSAKGRRYFFVRVELEAVLLGGGDVELLALFRKELVGLTPGGRASNGTG